MSPQLPIPSRLRAALALTFICLAASLSGPGIAAAELTQPQLVQDFAPGFYASGLAPLSLATVGDKLYFSASDPAHGREPWESDGTAAGSRRLADICPGDCSSNANGFTALGDAVFFEASDGDRSAIFKLTGGTLEKVVSADYYVSAWTVLGSHLYFVSSDFRLYRSSGTRESITEMADLAPNPCPTYSNCLPLTELVPVGEVLYFSVAGILYRLTEADGLRFLIDLGGEAGEFTALGTKVVFRACAYSASGACRAFVLDPSDSSVRVLEPSGPDYFLTIGATDFRPFRGRLYFEVWAFEEPYRRVASTDGTALGTRLENGFAGSRPDLVAATSNYLFYLSDTSDGAAAIYSFKSNGSSVLLHGNQGNYYGFFGQLGDQVFFQRADPGGINPPRTGYSKLVVSSGETFNTSDLRDGYPSAFGGPFQGSLYFALETNGRTGLWKSDGSTPHTNLILAGADTPASGFPKAYRIADRLLAESSTLPLHADRLAFDVDAATLLTQLVDSRELQVLAASKNAALLAPELDFNSQLFGWNGVSLEELPAVGRKGAVAVSDDDHFFFFTDAAPGQMLWESDGRAAGTHLLFDFSTPGTHCEYFGCNHSGALAASGNHVFFVADQDRGELPYRLSVWDRALRQKRTLYESSTYIPPLAFSRGRAVFLEDSDSQGRRFFISDGTAAGTKPFFEDRDGQQIYRWQVAGERIYLVLRSAEDQTQSLWVSDGTTAGTTRVLAPAARSFSNLTAAGDHLFFTFDDSASGRELGFSDGTTAGTRFFDLLPGPLSSGPRSLFATADQRLVFAAAADAAGSEAWISDGSRAGTSRLTDLNPGSEASSPSDFAQVGSRLFFQATDGFTGRELWALDLPAGRPACPADRLCFADDRFEVKVTAHAPNGDFVAQRAFAAAESGVFTFFSPNNWEMLVKVLDGCAVNQAFWVYAAAASDIPYTLTVKDRASGAERVYESTALPAGPLLDSAAFSTCALPAPDSQYSAAAPPLPAARRCDDDPQQLCLGPGGRFRVAATWQTAEAAGVALPLPTSSADSGLFTFFSPTNWELMVKVLDACALNNKFWVFVAGTTDQGFELTVQDRNGEGRQIYRNPLGQAAQKISDVEAFPCN